MLAEDGDGSGSGGMVDEEAAGFFPKMAVGEGVVDEDVTGLHVEALVDGPAGDDGGAGKMELRPGKLLRFGPAASGAAGEDGGVEVRDRGEEFKGVRHEGKTIVEVRVLAEDAPELLGADPGFDLARREAVAEKRDGVRVEVGEDAVAVKEDVGAGCGHLPVVYGTAMWAGCERSLAQWVSTM